MQSRAHSGTWSLVLLFVCIFAFWWGIAVLAQNNNVASVPYAPEGVSGPVAVRITSANNTYTYSGSVPLASPCDELGEGIAVNGQHPPHITVLLTLMKPSVACAQASDGSSSEPFSVSVSVASGTKAVLDGLTVNGIIMPTTIQSASAE